MIQIVIDPIGREKCVSVFPEPGSVAIVGTDFEAIRDASDALRVSPDQARELATVLRVAAREADAMEVELTRYFDARQGDEANEFL